MPFRIETDAHWRAVLGTDGPAWANAYLRTREHSEGDAQLHELGAWFDAAIATTVDMVFEMASRPIVRADDPEAVMRALREAAERAKNGTGDRELDS